MSGLSFSRALRLSEPVSAAFVGGGGKTTAMFQLAHELTGRVIVTTTTHLGTNQIPLADAHHVVNCRSDLVRLFAQEPARVILLSGGYIREDRITGPSPEVMAALGDMSKRKECHILVEADGSRGLPVKAPADHEPAVPDWVGCGVNVVGLSCIGKPLGPETAHRPERFAEISGLNYGGDILFKDILRVAINAKGGIKNLPTKSKKTWLLNHFDVYPAAMTEVQHSRALWQGGYDQCLVAALGHDQKVWRAFGKTAGIILAAGESTRMGGTAKQLLLYQGKTFIRRVCETALAAGLFPVIVVTGVNHEAISHAIVDLPVEIVHNTEWKNGQGGSVATGARCIPDHHDGVIFLLADMPQVTATSIQALIDRHETSEAEIVYPVIRGVRANPVLFDAITFPALRELQGEKGGRTLFSQFRVSELLWEEEQLLLDIDTPDDYKRLLSGDFEGKA